MKRSGLDIIRHVMHLKSKKTGKANCRPLLNVQNFWRVSFFRVSDGRAGPASCWDLHKDRIRVEFMLLEHAFHTLY